MAFPSEPMVSGRGESVRGGVSGLTLAGLFEAQVVRSPGALAVECGGAALSYAELR